MSRRNIEPYEHDCDRCIWVGWVKWEGNRFGNMYFCPPRDGSGSKGSVIVRFGNRADDYWSSPVGVCLKGPLNVDEDELKE